ncbi:ROK family protein [Lactobacillus sp. UCMA15818]|uniref:ROK family protein n=1 Tax=Lactobacillus sp. UCMA15818 TaxID=2583394 RepID=UPI0025AF7409|nr:ROK family protein [Lactobacillus sp. UCMA15818]MDN2452958.1 ROK family protein [Lactobacillus sp. UCMA15818]
MRNYLSIDIGGTAIKYGLIDHSGNLIEKGTVDTPQNLEEFKQSLIGIISMYKEKVYGLAFSVPGKVDSKQGIIYFGGSLPFLNGFNFEKFIHEEVGVIPVGVENDGKAAALAEMWLGNLKDIDDAAAIILGTGVGGGIIINGRLLPGSHFQAGELSFMMSNFNSVGYEELVGTNLSAVKMIEKIAVAENLTNKKDGRVVFTLINKGNSEVVKIFREYCKKIALLIINVQTVVDLTNFVIGGGISSQSILIKTINEEYDEILNKLPLLNDTLTRPHIQKAKFENSANLYGALYGLLQKIDNSSEF